MLIKTMASRIIVFNATNVQIQSNFKSIILLLSLRLEISWFFSCFLLIKYDIIHINRMQRAEMIVKYTEHRIREALS